MAGLEILDSHLDLLESLSAMPVTPDLGQGQDLIHHHDLGIHHFIGSNNFSSFKVVCMQFLFKIWFEQFVSWKFDIGKLDGFLLVNSVEECFFFFLLF